MGGLFGGSSGGTVKTVTKRSIPPQTPGEIDLFNQLYNKAMYEYYRPAEDFLSSLRRTNPLMENLIGRIYSDVTTDTTKPTYSKGPYTTTFFEPIDVKSLDTKLNAAWRKGQIYGYGISQLPSGQVRVQVFPSKSGSYSSSPYAVGGDAGLVASAYSPSAEFVNTMRNPYTSMMPVKEQIGKILNRLAARGVVNSTITQRALSDIGRWALERAAELKTKTMPMLEEARYKSKADELRRFTTLQELNRQETEDRFNRLLQTLSAVEGYDQSTLKKLAMAEDVRRIAENEQYRDLFNLWSTLYQGRMGVPTTVQTSTGPSMLSQTLGQATGLGLGYWLGPGGGFNTLGGALSSLGGHALAAIMSPTTWFNEVFGPTSGY